MENRTYGEIYTENCQLRDKLHDMDLRIADLVAALNAEQAKAARLIKENRKTHTLWLNEVEKTALLLALESRCEACDGCYEQEISKDEKAHFKGQSELCRKMRDRVMKKEEGN